jgi:mRNA interferase RelE/StbE
MSFRILYHPAVKDDLVRINEKLKKRIKKAVETRLMVAPEQYGEPLRKTLKGYWKMRIGDYRLVFKVARTEILVLGIIHRKNVYESVSKRK